MQAKKEEQPVEQVEEKLGGFLHDLLIAEVLDIKEGAFKEVQASRRASLVGIWNDPSAAAQSSLSTLQMGFRAVLSSHEQQVGAEELNAIDYAKIWDKFSDKFVVSLEGDDIKQRAKRLQQRGAKTILANSLYLNSLFTCVKMLRRVEREHVLTIGLDALVNIPGNKGEVEQFIQFWTLSQAMRTWHIPEKEDLPPCLISRRASNIQDDKVSQSNSSTSSDGRNDQDLSVHDVRQAAEAITRTLREGFRSFANTLERVLPAHPPLVAGRAAGAEGDAKHHGEAPARAEDRPPPTTSHIDFHCYSSGAHGVLHQDVVDTLRHCFGRVSLENLKFKFVKKTGQSDIGMTLYSFQLTVTAENLEFWIQAIEHQIGGFRSKLAELSASKKLKRVRNTASKIIVKALGPSNRWQQIKSDAKGVAQGKPIKREKKPKKDKSK